MQNLKLYTRNFNFFFPRYSIRLETSISIPSKTNFVQKFSFIICVLFSKPSKTEITAFNSSSSFSSRESNNNLAIICPPSSITYNILLCIFPVHLFVFSLDFIFGNRSIYPFHIRNSIPAFLYILPNKFLESILPTQLLSRRICNAKVHL